MQKSKINKFTSYEVNLLKYRLLLGYRLVRRRASASAEPFIPDSKTLRKKYRVGSFVAKFFRHIFEHKNIRRVLGSNLALLAITTSFLPQVNIQAQESVSDPVIQSKTNLVTKKGAQYPTQNIRITQGYSFYHRGIDLDGITGDPIRSIKPGKVLAVSYSKYAYGYSVLIDHGNRTSSLYAHLSEIKVNPGDQVEMDTEIGKMGATGRAFGDHLHLEVYDHDHTINPHSVLPR